MKAQKNESVKVAVRVRPLNKRQIQMSSPICVSTEDNVLSIQKQKDIKDFVFDYVFGISSQQKQVYESCAYGIVENALQGFNGTVFAYGQTGAGKTFSMVGDYTDQEWKGIIPRAFDHVITAIQTSQAKHYMVQTSFIEIYNEDIYDLLDGKGKDKKDLKESPSLGVFIKDLKSVPVKSVEELFRLLDYGNRNRTTAETKMNSTSSRSHAMFTVHIQSLEGEDKIKKSKLNFVDLAGSERQGKTGATGDTLKEGAKINLSLTALGNVINSLVDGKKGGHIPYRDSKLTRLLQDSLGGNTKTLMIASVSPAEDNHDETMSSLRYAARARNIKNTPKVNEDPKDAMIREYLSQIDKLKRQLGGGAISTDETSEELYEQLQQAGKEKDQKLSEKDAELLNMRAKMKEMEQLFMQKGNDNPEMAEQMKKRKLEKKKIMKNEEINQMRVHDIQDQEQKDLQQNQGEEGKDITYWKNLAKRLKKKLKNEIQDRKDINAEFEDERERLNECIRNVEGNLSFYRQIAEKFLCDSDIAALKDASTFDFEKREFDLPPFLLHDEKLNLPKTLKKREVDDLWQEKRKGYKMKFLSKPSNVEESSQASLKIPQNKSSVFSREYKQPTGSPFLQNRRMLKYINTADEKYKEKDYMLEGERETFFRRTNFLMKEDSNSQNKRPPSASFRVASRNKLTPLEMGGSKGQPSGEKRQMSKGREKLTPITKK